MSFLIGQLLDAGLLHSDVDTVAGYGLDRYRQEPKLESDMLVWHDGTAVSRDPDVLRDVAHPFDAVGGLALLNGNLGKGVIKISAVQVKHRTVEAPIRVFDNSDDLLVAFQRGELHRDVVAVVRFQGPQANGMPELHKLTPALGVVQDLGFRVALVTDGRMSGASGKIPAAIHVTPEALSGGPLARLRDGDIIRLDADAGTLDVKLDPLELEARTPVSPELSDNAFGLGRELFGVFRRTVGSADTGASVLFDEEAKVHMYA
jgi:phosphogluconate dehydratase